MKNFELIKAGQPSEVELLSENVMNNIIGGKLLAEKCDDYKTRCKGYEK